MSEYDKNDLSEMINSYIGGRPFQSLSSILKNGGFYNQNNNNFINSLEDSDFKSIKRHFTNLRKSVVSDISLLEEQNSSNSEIDSFFKFVSLILDVSTIIHKRDEQIIDNLQEKLESNKTSSAKQKSKGESDSRSKSTNDQTEVISKLKKKLNRANEQINLLKAQINLAKDEGKNEVIQGISDHYHLSQSSGTDVQNLLNNLDNCIEGNNSNAPSDSGENLSDNTNVVKNIVKSFNLPPDTNSKNIVSELQQKIVEMAKFNSAMNSQMKEDLENAPIGPNEDPENPSILRSQLVATINSLRAELDHLRSNLAEQDEVLQIFCNIPLKPDQAELIVQEAENNEKSYIQKVRDIVSILAIQIFQSEDTEAMNTRIISLVSGLFQFINSIGTSKAAYTSLYPEAPFEEMRPVLLSQAERVHLFLCENGHAFNEEQKSLFEELITNNNYYPLKGIDPNAINSMNLLTHVKNYLNEYNHKPSTVEGQVLYIIALEAVCASSILQRYSETVKNACTKQIHEAKQLKDYSVQLEKSIEDQQVYIQEMSLVQNEEKNNTRSENYDYGDNYYDNDRENSLSNNNRSHENSRNYDTDNQSYENGRNNDNRRRRENNNNSSLDNDNNNNGRRRENNNNTNSSIENENVKSRDVNKNNEKDEKDLNKVRSILRKGLTDHKQESSSKNKKKGEDADNQEEDCNCLEVILEALDHLNQKEVDIVPDDRYIQSLQSQLRDTISDNKELKKKNDNLIKETHDDIVNVQSQVSKINETMNKRIEMKTKQNQKLIKALKDAKESQDKLIKKNRDLQEKLNKANEKESEESSKQIAEEIQQNFIETKKDYENVLSQMKAKFESQQKELNDTKQQLEEEKKKNESWSKKIEQNEKAMKERIDKLKKKEAKAIDQASVLSEKYQEIHKDFVTLENEKKAMLEKYQNIEKEKSLIQASLKNYSETLENYEKLRKEHDQLLNDKSKENQKFLSKIASLFPTYADLSVTISKESIIEILKNVKEDLDTIPQCQAKTESKDEIIHKVKEALNIESESSIVEKLNSLIKSNSEMDQSNRYMYNELKASQESRLVYLQLQDWLIRMYVLVTGGVCQDITTLEMQHAIEDNITSKYENLVLSRKNGLLRAEKKLLLSNTFNRVNKEYEAENPPAQQQQQQAQQNASKKTKKNDDNDEEEEDQNQSSTEVDIDIQNEKTKSEDNSYKNMNNNVNNNNNTNKKKKRDKRKVSFRHLLIMSMLICKAKRLSGLGEVPYGLDVSDANAANGRQQYSTSFSPISKPANNNFVFGLD